MLQRARAVLVWSKTHEGKKIIRFTAVSVVSTAVSFASISVLYGFKIIPGVMWATLAGNLIASLPAYHLNRLWTWGKRGRSHFRSEILPFWSMTALGIAVSQIGAFWARHEVHTHHWAHLFNTALVSFTNLFSFGIFWVLKMMVFNRIFRVHELEEIDEHLAAEETTRS
ncbi:MAG: GtrA family protein [Acidimicrobiaceae bacterium]|nr:GtrA family protein [Acidimicrobiaceae bacterium]